jgi:glycosyltransferase involved in cell wall biosynthesis
MKPPEAAISEGRPLLNSSRQVYQHTFGTRLLRGASKVIALSDSERESLERIGAIGKNVVVMPNGVAPEDFANPPEPDLFRRKVGIGDEKIILYIGRVAKSKGLDTLVRSFKKLCEDKEGIRLVIAGPDDGYLEYLKELVKSSNLGEKVLFPGLISHEEKLSAYNSADVVVYPGTYEGFPIVPLEAAIMAKPVIVSDDPGMDYVSRGGFGLTFKFGHEDELKLALERLLSDEQLSRTLGSTGKACVMQNYTWEIVARRIEALYRSILSQ